MQIKSLISFVVCGVCSAYSVSSFADATDMETANVAIDTKLTFMSDVRTRGISDSLKNPGLKLSVQAAHESGLVALAEIGTASKKQFTQGNGMSMTLAGGYRFGDPEAWHFGTGVAYEMFPGAKFDAPQTFDFDTFTPGNVRSTNYNTSFAVIEIGYGALEARALNVLSQTYRGANTGGVCGAMLQFAVDPQAALACYARGEHGSRGSWLLDIDYKINVSAATTLNLHAGYQKISNFSEADFSDYRIGLTHKHWGYEWNVDWVGTHTKARELYLVQDGDQVRATDNNTIFLSVVKRF